MTPNGFPIGSYGSSTIPIVFPMETMCTDFPWIFGGEMHRKCAPQACPEEKCKENGAPQGRQKEKGKGGKLRAAGAPKGGKWRAAGAPKAKK